MKNLLIEICADSVDSAIAAEVNGADRIELCDNLTEGGTTPSAGKIKTVLKSVNIPVFVMIRPRGGDFLYTKTEFEVMRQDLLIAKDLGVQGIVLGILKADGSIDKSRTTKLVSLASPLPVTFHRAFDMANDPFQATQDLIECGVKRILTSGQKKTASEGLPMIEQLISLYGEKINFMAGAGIHADNIDFFINSPYLNEIHMTSFKIVESAMQYRNRELYMGSTNCMSEYELRVPDEKKTGGVNAKRKV